MPRTWEEACAIVAALRLEDTPLKRGMIEVRDRVNGDVVLPMIDVEGEPSMKAPSPAIIADTIDSTAMRAASTRASIFVPPVHQAEPESIEYATTRRRSLYASWHKSAMGLLLRKSYRHLTGYGEMCMVVMPDYNIKRPRVHVRDPLTAYPEPKDSVDVTPPSYCGFITGRSKAWLLKNFPEAAEWIGRATYSSLYETGLWDVLEWVDEDQILLGIIGPRNVTGSVGKVDPMLLRRFENRAGGDGSCGVIIGQRVTLDRVMSQVSHIIGTTDLMDRLLVLDVIAQERAIFTDKYAIAADNQAPMILSGGGRWQDGRTGEMNIIQNVKQIGELRGDTSPMTQQTIANLERAARQSGGLTGAMSGELNGSLRSGSTIGALNGVSIDPRVQELQEIMSVRLGLVNEAIGRCYRYDFAGRKLTLFSGWPTDKGHVELEPSVCFGEGESFENVVAYPFPGADINSVTVAVLQLAGGKLMSLHTARAKHPHIEDPEFEDTMVQAEAVLAALLAGFQAQVQSGEIPQIDAAWAYRQMKAGMALEDAIEQANQRAQERQAQQVAPDDPAAQAGLAMPGMGAEAPVAGSPAPAQGLNNFRQLTSALSAPVRQNGLGR